MVILLSFILTTVAEAQLETRLEPRAEAGFGRLVFSFDDLPEYRIDANAGVLVISFDEPVDVSLEGIDVVLSEYFSVGRIDPDRKAIRFALIEQLRVNAIEAGDELYVDLLPSSWQGAPPALPPEVIAALAARAEEAERSARDKLLREQMLRDASDVLVRIGRLPTFTRVQFDWPVTIKVAVTREEDLVKIQFDRYGHVDLAEINVQPTPHILEAMEELTTGGLLVTLKVAPSARLRSFREGQSLIFDISADEFAPQLSTGAAVLPRLSSPEGETIVDPGDASEEKVAMANGRAGPGLSPGTRQGLAAFDEEDIIAQDFTEMSAGIEPDSARFAPDSTLRVKEPGASADTVDSTSSDQTMAEGTRKAFAKAARIAVKATSEDGNLQLDFPFEKRTPMATFVRANVVWIVFDSVIPFDLRAVRRVAGGRLADITQTRTDGITILRLVMAQASLVTSNPVDKSWIVTVGDAILAPTEPIELVKGYREDGEPVVTAILQDAGSVHRVVDPIVGDTLSIVTAYGPARGLVKTQEFVDFIAHASSHGLAFSNRADTVEVAVTPDQVVISRPGGLVLTTGDLKLQGVRRDVDGSMFKSNYVNFDAWGRGGTHSLSEQIAALELAAANASEEERAGVRLAAARLLLARRFHTEALGLIRLTAAEDEAFSRDPTFLALRGVTNVLLGRTQEARSDLTDRRLRSSLDIKLWLGLADAKEGKWKEAQANLVEGESVIAAYPEELQAGFRFAAVEAALNTNDMAKASRNIETLLDMPLSDEHRGRLEILRGRYAEAMGRSSDAVAAFKAAMAVDVRPITADATWRLAQVMSKSKNFDRKAAIDSLENLIAVWRGDDIELQGMQTLADLYVDDNQPRRAFELMQTATRAHPERQLTRDFQDRMTRAFADLYLKGGADEMPPVEALALFYDFRELTPVGREGDEMIRKLSERLITVDLLDQAADLLDHQVRNRLKGAARAQVATQLAMVHLMNREPAQALRVIQQSRQAVLPGRLQRQRIILEARALAETGRVDLAMERLKAMEGDDIERLRADVLWRGESWQEAADQIERMLADNWSGTSPLNETQRQDVMRAAIGFSLAGDNLGLERLRRKFTSKMSESQDASAFNAVTAPIAEKGVEFRQMVRRIADIDTLEAFIADHRQRYAQEPDELPQG